MASKLRQHRPDRAADLGGVDTYRRNSAVDAAMMLAVSGGYEAVHVRAVAAQVGIGVSTLYRYFPLQDPPLGVGVDPRVPRVWKQPRLDRHRVDTARTPSLARRLPAHRMATKTRA